MRIDTIVFDMGGTLEDVRYDRDLRKKAFPRILDTMRRGGIVLPGDEDAVLDAVLAGNAAYKSWSEGRQIELPPADIWADWNLRDFRVDRSAVEAIAEELSYLWETTFFARKLRPDARDTLEALRTRGYRLGVISNTSSATQVFRTLDDYGIRSHFGCVVLSSIQGVRKPARAIFDAALNALGAKAETSAYVGDTLSRDVIGSKNAGYALAIQIRSFLTAASDASVGGNAPAPDHVIASLSEIVGIVESGTGRTAG